MTWSAFDIIGPIMVGPSSSHTAGAARIGSVALQLLGEPLRMATIGLHGSFASTGKGHATDRAIIAGLCGLGCDDARLPVSDEIAKQQGLEIIWEVLDLGEDAHPNSVQIKLLGTSGHELVLKASSIGGGKICVYELDGFACDIDLSNDTIILYHRDTCGLVAKVSTILAAASVNIASMRTSRHKRGERALTVVQVDGVPPSCCLELFQLIADVTRCMVLHPF